MSKGRNFVFSLLCAAVASLPACYAAEHMAGGVPLNTLQLNGSARYVSNTGFINLTRNSSQAASAFVPTPYTFGPMDEFEATFVFDAAMELGTPPADGLTFVAQNTTSGASFVGEDGSGLGYFSSSELPAVAATFDYISNQITGTPANTVGIAYTQGYDLAQAVTTFDLAGSRTSLRYVWVAYDNATRNMNVYVSETSTKPATPTVSTVLNKDLSKFLGGSAYFGFTAGTGSDYCYQTLQYFNLRVINRSN